MISSTRTTVLSLAAFALAAASARAQGTQATPPPAPPQQAQQGQPPQQTTQGGGDGGAKPRAAAMVIEEESTANEPPPPPPQGEEKMRIGGYIKDQSRDVQQCYADRLGDRPTLNGKLVVRFDIGPNGRVIGATADGIPDTELVMCVVKLVRNWQFDRPASGGKLRIAYPFVFKPTTAQ